MKTKTNPQKPTKQKHSDTHDTREQRDWQRELVEQVKRSRREQQRIKSEEK